MGDMTREPSMEEILSSIRRVIARDEDAQGNGGTGSFADDGDEEILELVATDTGDQPASELASNESASALTPEALVSEISAEASRQSLDALTAMVSSDADPLEKPAGQSGDITLNAMAEAMLRPMLKSWLDTNLPPMVERLVSREIARITGNRF
ncbi:MAG: DUF2497 domain-containing protein [Sphingopyxis sp.]